MDKELLENCLEMLNIAIYDKGSIDCPQLSPACRIIARRACDDLVTLINECLYMQTTQAK